MSNTTSIIKKVLLAFEQSRTSIKYDAVYMYEDGPENVKQITVSFGVTEYGNLKKLIKSYCEKNGSYKSQFEPYLPIIGVKPLVGNNEFIGLLKESASDKVMQMCQEQAYDNMYINPALAWCEKNQLSLPLSQLVIADSFLQSGSILTSIRNMFSAKLPANGGVEKDWIKQYCESRRSWLANHSRVILHNTVYRMDFMLKLIKENDWELTAPFYIANDVKIVAK